MSATLQRSVQLTGVERQLSENELIVSKTDLQGRITYANRTFQRISGYSEEELLGAPHSLVRHPDMPRAVFKLLWDTIQSEREIFAYVVNTAKNGDHYWVLAHVTPSFNESGRIVGFHSNRRRPTPRALEKIKPLYAKLREEEQRHASVPRAVEAGVARLQQILDETKLTYEQFIFIL
jgi:PAS domain S-box-containing protein